MKLGKYLQVVERDGVSASSRKGSWLTISELSTSRDQYSAAGIAWTKLPIISYYNLYVAND